jgi:hypothetical protein
LERFDQQRIILLCKSFFLMLKMLPFCSLANIDGGDWFSRFEILIFNDSEGA